MFSSKAIYLACFLALALNPSAVYSLPIPPRASSNVLPVRFGGFNPQHPFSRQTPPTKLRFAHEEHDNPLTASSTFAASASSFSFANIDTIFADSLQAGGVEASLAAVLASRQMQRVDGLRREALAPRLIPGMKKVAKRDWVVPGRPAASVASTLSSSSSPSSSSFTTPVSSATSSSSPSSTLVPSSTEAAIPSPVVWTLSEPAEETTTTTSVFAEIAPCSASGTSSGASTGERVWYLAPEPTHRVLLPKASFGSLADLAN
ncbi:hypothetical protein JCM11251_004971 [Rhodosporidiobolus azoricus]